MIRSNIKGLASTLNKLDARIKALEAISLNNVKGGKNTNVRRVGNNITINSKGEGESITSLTPDVAHPWAIDTYLADPADPNSITVKVGAGTINGVIPNNALFPLAEKLSATRTYWIYVWVTFDGVNISDCSIRIRDYAETGFNRFGFEYVKGGPPDTFEYPIGIVKNGNVQENYLRKNLKVNPVIAFQKRDGSNIDLVEDYWTWDVYPI